MPRTWAVKKSNRREKVNAFQYPIILKQPDSAFSLGVLKANSPEDCMEKLNVLFKHSEIVVAQEYIPTAYDWRIGVLDKKPIFACKYYMAKGHWQIYNWDELCGEPEGDSETLPIELVPQKVLRTAVKAANVMGDGFYGVDLKEVGSNVLVIEVNDNPSVDFGVEDAYLGDRLYAIIMQSFCTRLKDARTIIRKISY
jgi:glutathione synthase/RimK-type ligase-like ATP-grasp enzyme